MVYFFLCQIELQVQENRKKKEVKIGTEPVSEKGRLTDECYEELKALAEEIGIYSLDKATSIFITFVSKNY